MNLLISCKEIEADDSYEKLVYNRDFLTEEDFIALVSNQEYDLVEVYDYMNIVGIHEIVKKIKFKNIKLVGKDLNLIVDFYYRHYISFSEMVINIYENAKVMYNVADIQKYLEENGLEVDLIRIDGFHYHIEASR